MSWCGHGVEKVLPYRATLWPLGRIARVVIRAASRKRGVPEHGVGPLPFYEYQGPGNSAGAFANDWLARHLIALAIAANR